MAATMRSLSFFLAIAVIAPTEVFLVADEPQSEPENVVLRKLQGHWEAEKWVIHGKDTSEGRDNRSYRIDKRQMVFVTDRKEVGTATFKIDVSNKPYKMDLTYVGGPRDGQTLLGIFRFDDDKLINCFSYPGDPRPTSFESTAANRYFLSIDRKKMEKGKPADATERRSQAFQNG